MIRKAIIVVLTLASAVTGVLTPLTCSGNWLVWESATTPDALSGPDWAVRIGDGRVSFETTEYFATRQSGSGKEWSFTTLGKCDWLIGIHQLYYGHAVFDWHGGTSRRQSLFQLSQFSLFLLLAFYPAITLVRGPLRRWRRRRGLCLKCGYDLTGTESGVCPECGTKM